MCGRYSNSATPGQIAKRFSLGDVPIAGTGRFNIAPTDEVLILTGAEPGSRARTVRWGLIPPWATDRRGAARLINARCETIGERRAFAPLVGDARRRCLVVSNGFYEWLAAEDPKQPKVPIWFSLPDRQPFAFAGLWTTWYSPDGEEVPTCTILTTRADRVVAPIHDRMPVILASPERWRLWLDAGLDGGAVGELAGAHQPSLIAHRANPIVNSVRNDGPECLIA